MTRRHHAQAAMPEFGAQSAGHQPESIFDFFRDASQPTQRPLHVEHAGTAHSRMHGRERESGQYPAFSNIFAPQEQPARAVGRPERGRHQELSFFGGFGSTSESIARAAREAVGTSAYRPPSWSNFRNVSARLGCASTVTGLVARGLEEHGVDPHAMRNLHQVGISAMEQTYRRYGMLQEISADQAGSGDLVVGQRGRGRHGHTGILLNDGNGAMVVHNAGGVTKEQPLNAVFGNMSNRYYRIVSPGSHYA